MSSRRKRLLLSHGYIALADIEAAMARVAARAAELDAHLALEYLLDPALGPLEQRIERLSKRRAHVLLKLFADELERSRRAVSEEPAPGES